MKSKLEYLKSTDEQKINRSMKQIKTNNEQVNRHNHRIWTVYCTYIYGVTAYISVTRTAED